MKKSLILAVMLCCGSWVFAQSTSGSSDTQSGNTPNASTSDQATTQSGSDTANSQSNVKLRGCLQQGNGTFDLKDTETGTTYSLFGQSDLSSHVGHDIEVTGQPSGTSGHTADSQDANSTGKNASDNPFRVQTIRDVGECSSNTQPK